MKSPLSISQEDLISIKNRYAEMMVSEKEGDIEIFKASLFMLLAILDPYWEVLNFTFGDQNLSPLYGLVKFTVGEFGRIPGGKKDVSTKEQMRETRKIISHLLKNNGIHVEKPNTRR